MAERRIKWYSPQLGHGFILCEYLLGEVFMRSEDITGGDPWSLDTGDKVTFEWSTPQTVASREPSPSFPKTL